MDPAPIPTLATELTELDPGQFCTADGNVESETFLPPLLNGIAAADEKSVGRSDKKDKTDKGEIREASEPPPCLSRSHPPLRFRNRETAKYVREAHCFCSVRPRNSRARQTSSPAQLSNTRANFVTETDCEIAIPSWFLCPLFACLFDTEINEKGPVFHGERAE